MRLKISEDEYLTSIENFIVLANKKKINLKLTISRDDYGKKSFYIEV